MITLQHGKQRLKPVLGETDVVFIVIAATIGGGLFTLLGPSIGLSGASIIAVVAADGALGLLTALRYAELSNALPDVGGGQQWIRQGLGSFGGHMSGWISWLAHSVACGVYAISLGFYVNQSLLHYMPQVAVGDKIFAIATIIILSVVNYLGVQFTGRINKYGSITALLILLLFVVSGFITSAADIEASARNFSNFFGHGVPGFFSGMGMFYLAFQGSEVGAQAGEEVQKPTDLKRGIIIGLFVISITYLLVVFVAIAGVHVPESPSASYLSEAKEGALIAASLRFKLSVVLYPAILIGGIIVAFIALNATIYSSSHAFLALARHQSIPRALDRIDPRFQTPTFGIIISGLLILAMAAIMPLRDIAVVADVLFMSLFALLHLAYADLRRRKKALQTGKVYTLPFYPYLEIFPIPGYPYSIVLIYAVLIVFMWHVSPIGVLFGLAWLLLGVLIYSRYAMIKEIEEVDSSTVYGFEVRRNRNVRFKVHCPFSEFYSSAIDASRLFLIDFVSAVALKRKQGAKFFYYGELNTPIGLSDYYELEASDKLSGHVDRIKALLREKNSLSFGGAGRLVHDKAEDIVEMVQRYDADVLVMPIEQFKQLRRGFSMMQFGHVLQEIRCDLLVVKIGDVARRPERILVPFRRNSRNPSNRLLAETLMAFVEFFGAKVTFLVVDNDKNGSAHHETERELIAIGLGNLGDIRIIRSNLNESIASAIVEHAKDFDVILMDSSRGGSFREINLGKTAEAVLAGSNKTTIIVKHSEDVFDPIMDPFTILYRQISKYLNKKSLR